MKTKIQLLIFLVCAFAFGQQKQGVFYSGLDYGSVFNSNTSNTIRTDSNQIGVFYQSMFSVDQISTSSIYVQRKLGRIILKSNLNYAHRGEISLLSLQLNGQLALSENIFLSVGLKPERESEPREERLSISGESAVGYRLKNNWILATVSDLGHESRELKWRVGSQILATEQLVFQTYLEGIQEDLDISMQAVYLVDYIHFWLGYSYLRDIIRIGLSYKHKAKTIVIAFENHPLLGSSGNAQLGFNLN